MKVYFDVSFYKNYVWEMCVNVNSTEKCSGYFFGVKPKVTSIAYIILITS